MYNKLEINVNYLCESVALRVLLFIKSCKYCQVK